MLKPKIFSKLVNSIAIFVAFLVLFNLLSDPYNDYYGEESLKLFFFLIITVICFIAILFEIVLYLINVKALEKNDKIFLWINILSIALGVILFSIPPTYLEFLCSNKECHWENAMKKGAALEACNDGKTDLNKISCYKHIVGAPSDYPSRENKYSKDLQPCYEYLKIETRQDKSWFNNCINAIAHTSENDSFCDSIDEKLNLPGQNYTRESCIKISHTDFNK